MADKSVGELIAAQSVTPTDLFVLEQNGTAKKLTGQILENWLVSFADGHGGIQSIVKRSTSGLADTYRITLADTTVFDFVVTNGRGISSLQKTGTSGLVDTYTFTYNDGTKATFTVTNGQKGDKGDNAYIWVKYASQQPTASSNSFGDLPDDWMGVYFGTASTAPTNWQQYKWYRIKGAKGDTGDPATIVSASITYQAGDSGTVIPSGSWSTSIPAVTPGRYLWTRQLLQFNTGAPITSYSVSRFGIDGTGAVSTVAGVAPDETGNVPLDASNVKALAIAGGTMEGAINMNGKKLSGLNTPTKNDEAATKGYVDNAKPDMTGYATETYVNQKVKEAAPRNLLDNSDFTNPVNQRGGSFANKRSSYPVDKWMFDFDNANTTASANFDATNRYLYMTRSNSAGFYGFGQSVNGNIKNKTFTVAVDCDSYGATFDIAIITESWTEIVTTTMPAVNGRCCMTFNSGNNDYIRVVFYPNSNEFIIRNAALYEGEYTTETLPEYQPKGYDAELLACQTQLQRFHTESERKTYCEDFRPTMRMTPNGMVSKFEQEIDGVTYYFASAEL